MDNEILCHPFQWHIQCSGCQAQVQVVPEENSTMQKKASGKADWD